MLGRSCSSRAAFCRGFGLLVDLLGFLAFLDLAHNNALADAHFQRIDRGVLRQREDINALKPGIGGVMKILRDHGPRDKARDRNLDIRPQHGRGTRHKIIITTHQQGAGFGFSQLHRLAKRRRTAGKGTD